MASNNQLEANKANAQKSTGPRTQQGKARSRLNSRKHGLTAKMLVIAGEQADDFDELRTALTGEHDPQSALEYELVERLAVILWRLRRAPFFEATILAARQGHVALSYGGEIELPQGVSAEEVRARYLGEALYFMAATTTYSGKLARYETTLMNALTRTLQLIQEIRGDKRKPAVLEAVALPAVA